MNRFPAAWRRQHTTPEPLKSGDAEIDTALHEAQLWMNALQGHVASLFDENPKGAAVAISKSACEARDWLNLLVTRARRYYQKHPRDAQGRAVDLESYRPNDAG
jgi:hypothetical protein